MIELLIILGIFFLAYIFVLKDFEKAFYVLMVLSLFLHKELFSFYRWDLMPIRAFMLALFCAGVTKIYMWFIHGRDEKKFSEIFSNPFLLLLVFLWAIRGISILFTKNLQASLLIYGFFTTVVFLLFYIFHFLKNSPEKTLKYIKFYIYCLFGLTLFGYFQYFLYAKTGVIIGALWNIPGNIPRVGSTFWDVNHYGALLASVLPLMGVFVLALKSKKTKNSFWRHVSFTFCHLTPHEFSYGVDYRRCGIFGFHHTLTNAPIWY
jgi:hypothetical protein